MWESGCEQRPHAGPPRVEEFPQDSNGEVVFCSSAAPIPIPPGRVGQDDVKRVHEDLSFDVPSNLCGDLFTAVVADINPDARVGEVPFSPRCESSKRLLSLVQKGPVC